MYEEVVQHLGDMVKKSMVEMENLMELDKEWYVIQLFNVWQRKEWDRYLEGVDGPIRSLQDLVAWHEAHPVCVYAYPHLAISFEQVDLLETVILDCTGCLIPSGEPWSRLPARGAGVRPTPRRSRSQSAKCGGPSRQSFRVTPRGSRPRSCDVALQSWSSMDIECRRLPDSRSAPPRSCPLD